ncbi:MAG: hypothetical protein ACLQVI_15130 [Polyangiaceae bacterium]
MKWTDWTDLMATILVLAHEHDIFNERHFLLAACFARWEEAGHRVVVHEGVKDLPPADLAFLHVDCTVVPDAYIDALSRYRVVVNGATRDIGKRAISRHLVSSLDGYRGPVIVKTNANAAGLPERFHAAVAHRKGLPAPPAVRFMTARYPVYESIARVPSTLRLDPGFVVERFVPERGEGGYYVRHWLFVGARERCTRTFGPHPVVRGADATERVSVPVPDELRAMRRALGFDYGKLDFVVHDGEVVLLDANRTPTAGGPFSDAVRAYMTELADGVTALLA